MRPSRSALAPCRRPKPKRKHSRSSYDVVGTSGETRLPSAASQFVSLRRKGASPSPHEPPIARSHMERRAHAGIEVRGTTDSLTVRRRMRRRNSIRRRSRRQQLSRFSSGNFPFCILEASRRKRIAVEKEVVSAGKVPGVSVAEPTGSGLRKVTVRRLVHPGRKPRFGKLLSSSSLGVDGRFARNCRTEGEISGQLEVD